MFSVDPQSHGFTVNPSIMPDGGNNIVFLFVNTETNVSMDYYIINRNQPQYFTNRKLRGEGKIRYVIYIKIY